MRTASIYIGAWFGMILLALLNGALRVALIGRYVSELRAHQLSTLSLIALFSVYIRFIVGRFPPESSAQAAAIGAIWVVMTVTFEFLFGHYVSGYPWNALFRDYNLLAGRIWILVLIWTGIAPFVFYRIQS